MSLLGAGDGESRSYPEIADAIRRHGAAARADLRELWRRMVLTVLISNTDDHLRNHGFLYDGPEGWRLSPAYDLNPVPVDLKHRVLSTALGLDEDRTSSLNLALESAAEFDLSRAEARALARTVADVVATWRRVATQQGATAREIERMASAFKHADLTSALAVTVGHSRALRRPHWRDSLGSIGDLALGDVILDRLFHHAHRNTPTGGSLRSLVTPDSADVSAD